MKRARSNPLDIANEYPVSGVDPALLREPFEDGFSSRTVIGALFVTLIMMPGSIYLGLVAGQTIGPAAEWVTIILFAELARRSFSHLKRQEVFILFYVASSIAAVQLAHLALSGGPFAGTIWNQFLLQSPQTNTIASQIPDWVVPPADSPGIQDRNLAHVDWWWSQSNGWLAPMTMIAIGYVLGRFAWIGLGYLLFRVTSDYERLPFPLAPIAAAGATALSESTDREEGADGKRKRSWRWSVFSVGASLGIVFGALYVLLPAVTGLFMAKPIMLFPIPFVDFTSNVEHLLPASLVSISFDFMLLFGGMLIPFRMVIGTVVAVLLSSVFGNALLLKLGAFPHWKPGNGLLVNQMVLGFDFYMSAGLGLALAVAIIGLSAMAWSFYKQKRGQVTVRSPAPEDDITDASQLPPGCPMPRTASKERGDYPLPLAIFLFLFATAGFAWITHRLIPGFPTWIILIFGFLWSPLQSYVSARLIGLTGRPIGVPYLKEAVFILSGYEKVDIWFAPIPLWDFGGTAQKFRELELTRTKFTSIIKAELLMLPIVFVGSFLFWWFFWRLNQIPSDSFPFAARMWPVAARQAYLIYTANSPDIDQPLLLQALKAPVILGALGGGVVLYLAFSFIGIPVTFFYGLIGGIGQPTHMAVPLLIGALAGRYYFRRKFGQKRWSDYLPVVTAGFSCGMGLSGMVAVALSLIAHSTRELPF